jgi:hypothetical protein
MPLRLGAPPPLSDTKLMTSYFRDAAVASVGLFTLSAP